ncbi:MAG: DoxX family protein [Sphingomonadales bacterium]|nr:MAG: DoxX family protein [Sphingomonadales bacterium]
MSRSPEFSNSKEELFIPALGGFYNKFAQPVGWVIFRAVLGGMLMIEGWPKISDPMAQVGFVESLGFWPGAFWSPFLAALQFVGGAMLIVGLLTRPIALALAVMLLITLWFHMANPYPAPLLTEAGIAALKATPELFTPDAQGMLQDGGAGAMHMVQMKAEFASLFWAGGVALFAAFGGGYFSIDRWLLRKQV